jgi:hypothetical protein
LSGIGGACVSLIGIILFGGRGEFWWGVDWSGVVGGVVEPLVGGNIYIDAGGEEFPVGVCFGFCFFTKV